MTSFAYERYRTGIANLFSEEGKLNLQLQVERELTFANYQLGKLPKEAWEEISQAATPELVKLTRVKEIESETHHDLMSVVLAISEQCKNYGGYVHLGATSNDIQDTVLGLQLNKAKVILLDHLNEVLTQLQRLATEYEDVVCVGRTHGQQAIPITYGFKFTNFHSEVRLARDQLMTTEVGYGKMAGAVGNYASYGTMEVEEIVLKQLGLQKLPITTQVIPRIIHSRFIFALVTVAASLERLAKEIRNLQRTEIGELAEQFGSKQVGSSTMPHKRNPHKSEQICGIAKYLRSMVSVELENIPLEHERDLTNSSSERLVIPQVTTLTDYVITQMSSLLKGLGVDHERVKANLHLTEGRICAERLMIRLTEEIGRQEAHEILNRLASVKGSYVEAVLGSVVANYLSEEEIRTLLTPENYIGLSKEVVKGYWATSNPPSTYADAGVDIREEALAIKKIGEWVKKTFEFGNISEDFGHYANTVQVGESLLGLTTDGVGSKILVADAAGKYDTIGIDCVAMNVNDLLCLGMKPIAFVDYLATDSSFNPELAEQVAKGLYEGCRQAQIPILGGELATLPDIVKGFDIAGTALGIAPVGQLIDGSKIQPDDVVLGLPSNGIHSNGFSLARKVLFSKYKLSTLLRNGRTVGEELLRPTKIYREEILQILEQVRPHGIAHITGSGFRKLMRLSRYGCELSGLPEPELVFAEIKEHGNVSWSEMYSTFNMGVGMVVIVSPEDVQVVKGIVNSAVELGVVTEDPTITIPKYNVVLDR